MAGCAKAADKDFLVPLPNLSGQNSEDRKSVKGKGYLKAICSKAKNGARCNHKRKVCSTVDLSSIEPEFDVITLSDSGKLVLRRNSFENQANRPCSPCEYRMLENLLGVSLDVKKKENNIDKNVVKDHSNRSKYKGRNDLSSKRKNSVEKRDFASNRRMQRRHAVVQVTPNSKDVLLTRLRALALEQNLVNNGLLK